MLAITTAVGQLNLIASIIIFVAAVLLCHLLPYLIDTPRIRSYPGPFLAKFSDAWLGWVSSQGHRSEVVHELHKKYGPFVRLAPNHMSISAPEALQIVYAHGNGTLKSKFYDAFVSIRRGVFNTRDRAEHARKRKNISHIFSPKSVVAFEPNVRLYVEKLIDRWDSLFDLATAGKSGPEGEGWRGEGGALWLDCLPWYNYLAFDIIGDLAFGSPFGMLDAAKDSAPVPKSTEYALKACDEESIEVQEIPAIQILNDRGEFSASMGVLPGWWRPIVKFLPWYRRGNKAVQNLAGIAAVKVAKRLAAGSERVDLLSKLQEGTDEFGNPLTREEVTAEALTALIAGSDTTSNSSCAITYHLARNIRAQKKLQEELVEEFGPNFDGIPMWDQVKKLPYLEAVINEALRIHSTSSIGLPRVVPEGGLNVCGRFFPEGTVLSVPSYSIHRDTTVWGDDAEDFRPERWFERDRIAIQKTFNPFSFGPRACVGRNLAFMELQLIVASVFLRYSLVLEDDSKSLETREGFLRKPLECKVGLRRRRL